MIFGDPDKKVNENADYQSSDWYQKALSYTADIIVSPSHVQNLVKDEYPWVISVSKAIVDRETGEVTGVLVIDLNYKAIESICEKVQLGQSGYIYLVDSDANLIYHPQQQLIYTGLKTENTADILKMPDTQSYFIDNQSKKIYTRNFSLLTGWSVVGVLNANELADQKSLINFVVLVALASILLASFLAIMISTVMTRPIKQLENTMHEVEKGNFNVRSDIRLNNEIGHLSNTFNVMVSDIQKLMEQTIRDEEEKRKSEIKALQAQINPHFLYNTLDTIIWMSASGKNDEVVEVTSALAKLFRTSISTGEMLVTLAVEIENIKSYLIIQKMRYKDKLRYRLDIPDSLLNCRLPKLILQPIVENAIYHGIKLSPTGGEILIQGSLQGENLLLSVSDNGVGMTGQQLERLFDPKDSSRGIGIHNVHNRIQLFFGNQYGLSIQSRDGEGTRVDILLPNLPMPTTPNEEGESENG